MNIPVFLMGFANDREGEYLRGIAKEQDAIKDALDDRLNMCKLKIISDLSLNKLTNTIRKVQPTVFHYGGHADGDHLMLNSNNYVNAASLAKLLTHFSGVELVFLNGCATYNQADQFRKNGVRHVIVTNKLISDNAAVEFAFQFYHALAKGNTVPQAFEWASTTLKAGIKSSGANRSILLKRGTKADPNMTPWELLNDDSRPPWKWTEPTITAWGRVKAEKKYGGGLSGVKVRKGKEIKAQTDEEGIFNIEIKHSLLGKRLDIMVEKPNYRVVNEADLRVIPEVDLDLDKDKKLVEIIMCSPEKWEQ